MVQNHNERKSFSPHNLENGCRLPRIFSLTIFGLETVHSGRLTDSTIPIFRSDLAYFPGLLGSAICSLYCTSCCVFDDCNAPYTAAVSCHC